MSRSEKHSKSSKESKESKSKSDQSSQNSQTLTTQPSQTLQPYQLPPTTMHITSSVVISSIINQGVIHVHGQNTDVYQQQSYSHSHHKSSKKDKRIHSHASSESLNPQHYSPSVNFTNNSGTSVDSVSMTETSESSLNTQFTQNYQGNINGQNNQNMPPNMCQNGQNCQNGQYSQMSLNSQNQQYNYSQSNQNYNYNQNQQYGQLSYQNNSSKMSTNYDMRQIEYNPSEDEYVPQNPELSQVTSILKSMENDLSSLIKKEQSVTHAVKQMQTSQTKIHAPNQIQDLQKKVQSNEKMLEKVSSEFGRLKSFSMSMSEMVVNNNLRESNQREKPNINSFEETEPQPVISQLKFQKKIVEWTNKCSYRMVYRSTRDGLNARSLNARICGKSNILLIVLTSKGYVFGSYSSKTIPMPPNVGDVHLGNDEEFFVYSFNNPHGILPTKIHKKNHSTSLKIYSNKERSYVIGVDCCFYIRANCPCHIPLNFAENYEDTTGKGNLLFVDCVYPEKFALQELLAVELCN